MFRASEGLRDEVLRQLFQSYLQHTEDKPMTLNFACTYGSVEWFGQTESPMQRSAPPVVLRGQQVGTRPVIGHSGNCVVNTKIKEKGRECRGGGTFMSSI